MMAYYNWQKATAKDRVRFRKASPNLVQLKDYLIKRFGGTSVGIFYRRPVRGGKAPSSHSFGAALDWRYGTRRTGVAVANWLVKNHVKLGVQVVIDYVGCRQWIVGSGWKPMKADTATGVGQAWAKWLHVETTREAWGDRRSIGGRL